MSKPLDGAIFHHFVAAKARPVRSALWLASVCCLAAPGAMAQQAGGKGGVVLDTINIESGGKASGKQSKNGHVKGYVAKDNATATKTDTPIIETPQAISVITGDQITDQAAQTVSQALRYTPGVVAETRGASGAKFDLPSARGYSLDRYMDGMKIPSIGSYGTPHPDVYLFERLEVLKGPSSILYGQAAPGGILNMVSKRPTEEPFGEVRLEGGSWDRIYGAFDFGGPANADKTFLYRLTGLGWTGHTQVDSTRNRQVAIAPAFTWKPDADTSLTILGAYQRDPDTGTNATIPAIGSAVANPLGRISTAFNRGEPDQEKFDRYFGSIGYTFEHRFDSGIVVRSSARYIKSRFDWTTVVYVGLLSDYRTIRRNSARYYNDGYGVTADNSVEFNYDTGPLTHKTLLGVDYQYTDADNVIWSGTASSIDMYNPVYGVPIRLNATPRTSSNQVQKQLGFYAQDQISLGGLRVLLGGRYDRAETNTLNRLSSAETDMSDGAFTGRAGLLYLFDSGLAPYVSYSQSFQPTSGTDYYGNPFDPRRGNQIEAGLKYQPLGMDALFTMAVFQMNETNRTTTDPDHPQYSIQLGEVRTRGIELEARAAVTDSLDLIAGYSYIDARITESNAADLGKRLANVPPHNASLWGKYTFHDGGLAGLGVGLGVRYLSAAPANTASGANYFQTPSSTLVDAAISYDFAKRFPQLKGMRADLNVANLFDRKVATACGGNLAFANGVSGAYCFYGARRTITGSLSYRW